MKEKKEEDERDVKSNNMYVWGTQMISNSTRTSWKV